ncbi:hypothetical protein Tco_0336163 [Tanacetum coccineum]
MQGVEVWRRVRLPKGDKEVFVYLVIKCGDGGACKVTHPNPALLPIDVENYAEALTHPKLALHPIDVENYDASPNIILISSDDENDDKIKLNA